LKTFETARDNLLANHTALRSSAALAATVAVALLSTFHISELTLFAQASWSFTDISASAPLNNSVTGSHGAMWADATGDGLPELYLTYNDFYKGLRQNYFYRNLGSGRFSEEAAARGIDLYSIGTHGATFGDLDNDGDYDLVAGMTYGSFDFPIPAALANVMFRNDGGGFVNVTPPDMAAYADYTRSTLTFDADRDGDLDIYAVNGDRGDHEVVPSRNEAYRNDGGMRFSAIRSGPLVTKRAGQGATDTDYDGDGDIDLIAANITGKLTVLRNEGGGAFSVVEPESIGILHTAGSGITSADMDNDGDFDLMLVDQYWESPRAIFEHSAHLYRNVGGGRFVYEGRINGFGGFTAGAADLDNDGDLDLVFPGFPNVLLNDGAFHFAGGPALPGPRPDGERDPRSVAFADIEGDGDLDFAITDKNGPAYLVRNNFNAGRWLKVRLIAANGQAGAFGAKVRVSSAGGGRFLGIREAKSSSGYLAQDDPVLHFGLGAALTVDVEVTFLDGTRVTRNAVAANQTITIVSTPATEAPSAPQNLAASVSGSLVTFTWDAPTTGGIPAEYVLEAGTFSGSTNVVFLSTGSLARSISASAPPGTYYVRVKARNINGIGAPSNEVVVAVAGAAVPQAPVGLSFSKSGQLVDLTWNPPPGGPAPTSYLIEAGSQSGASNIATFDVGLSTGAQAMAAPGTYFVRVRARASGGIGPPSNEVVIQVP
jgi:hypothetical protein